VHPPVKVGNVFNEVVSASEERHTTIIKAQTEAVTAIAKAEGEAAAIRADAASYRHNRMQVALAEAERFGQQLRAYLASPELFPLRSFLSVLEEEAAGLRKYIVAVKGGREVVILNLEERLGNEILDINLDREN
jgi:regulator of protease activity HflC (stomatin/prohibitin superfamily)